MGLVQFSVGFFRRCVVIVAGCFACRFYARVGLDEFVYESFYAGGSALLVFYPVSQLARGVLFRRYCLFLGLSVVALGLIIWLVILLVKDPKGVVKSALYKKKG